MSVARWGLNGSIGYNSSSSMIQISPGESIIGLEVILNRSRVPLDDGTAATGLIITAIASELVLNPRGKKVKVSNRFSRQRGCDENPSSNLEKKTNGIP